MSSPSSGKSYKTSSKSISNSQFIMTLKWEDKFSYLFKNDTKLRFTISVAQIGDGKSLITIQLKEYRKLSEGLSYATKNSITFYSMEFNKLMKESKGFYFSTVQLLKRCVFEFMVMDKSYIKQKFADSEKMVEFSKK